MTNVDNLNDLDDDVDNLNDLDDMMEVASQTIDRTVYCLLSIIDRHQLSLISFI